MLKTKKEASINSRWVTRTGIWDNNTKSYTKINEKETFKNIKMKIVESCGKKILQFIGGPTGFEAFYIDDLSLLSNSIEFCICAGTINSWPACFVNRKELLKFIN